MPELNVSEWVTLQVDNGNGRCVTAEAHDERGPIVYLEQHKSRAVWVTPENWPAIRRFIDEHLAEDGEADAEVTA